jgi:hypothetical protein
MKPTLTQAVTAYKIAIKAMEKAAVDLNDHNQRTRDLQATYNDAQVAHNEAAEALAQAALEDGE